MSKTTIKSRIDIVEILLNRVPSDTELETHEEESNVDQLILNSLESAEFTRLHLGSFSCSMNSVDHTDQRSEIDLENSRYCHGYYLQYTARMITKAGNTMIHLSAPIHDRNGVVRLFDRREQGLASFTATSTNIDFRNLINEKIRQQVNLPRNIEMKSIKHSLCYLPIRNVNPLPVYTTLFSALLERELSTEDYHSHFSKMSFKYFFSSIISAEEFFHKRIFKPLNNSSLCRIETIQDLDMCMPSHSDYSIFSCLSFENSNVNALLLIPMWLNELFFLDRDSLNLPETPYTPIHLSEQSAYNLFFSSIRSSEILNKLVNQIFPSCRCDLDILTRLQESYAIPVLESMFRHGYDINISLVTSQWIGLNFEQSLSCLNPQVYLAVPD